MKIHKLTLTNINSLLGTWEINFDDEAYCQNGIFGIVGNTGAGKTTLLDAICLAIYRETPRLGKITENNNALMTIGATECQAKVELSIHRHQKINRYVFLFSQTRSTRGKNKGNLQEPHHEIYLQDDKGQFHLMSEKRSESERLAVELLGMDFTQFTRSVLLAQGGFSAFLQADGEKRGQILEKITGTEIYADIGKKVYHTYKAKEVHLNHQKEKLGDIVMMSDDELTKLKSNIDNITHHKSALENQLILIDDKLKQKQQHKQLTHDLAIHQQKLTKITYDLVNFEPNLLLLKNAKHHNELLPIFNHLNSLKAKQNDLKHQESILTEQLNHEKYQLSIYQDNLNKNQEHFNRHLSYLKKQINDKQHFLTHYQAICHLNGDDIATHVMNVEHQLDKLLNKTNELKQKQDKTIHVREQKEHAKHQLCQYHEMPNDGDIEQYVMALGNELRDVGTKLASIDNFIHQFKQSSNKKANQQQKQNTLHEQQIVWQNQEHEFHHQQMLLQQLMNEHELLDKNYRLSDEINRLNDFIDTLKEGSPCPLCGSEHHPYAHNPPMRENMNALKEQLTQKNAELAKYQHTQKEFELKLRELKAGIIHQTEQLRALDDEIKHEENWLNNEWRILSPYVNDKVDFSQLNEQLLQEIKQHFINATHDKKETYDTLSKTLNDHRHYQQKEQELLQEWKSIKHDFLAIFDGLIHAKNQLLPMINHEYQLIGGFLGQQSELAVIIEVFDGVGQMKSLYEVLKGEQLVQFYELASTMTAQMPAFKHTINAVKTQCLNAIHSYQQKYHECEQEKMTLSHYQQVQCHDEWFDVDEPINMSDDVLSQQLKNYQEVLRGNREALALSEQKIHDLTHRLDDNHRQAQINQQELSSIERTFQEKLSQHFKSDEEFLTAKLADDELNDLQTKYQHLTDSQTQTQIKIHDLQKQLEIMMEINKDMDEWQMEALINSHATLKNDLEALLTDFGIKQEKYAQAMQNQHKRLTLLKEIEQLENEFLPLHQLNELIGSSDGKKYRNFAQTLTLRALLTQANMELSRINKRYLLTPSEDDKNILGIDVIDTYQGDVVRQSKNLSGGESFIVSLALALGLSKMSSQRMQIDSLFLDEGFGTLDEEALELALSALSEIQSDGKMIGIISHIGSLKERLHTKISVEKKSGGVSVLVGAGVVRIG